ncbi:MAG: hypothetical protein RR565_07500 [Erysipelothrix sp.]
MNRNEKNQIRNIDKMIENTVKKAHRNKIKKNLIMTFSVVFVLFSALTLTLNFSDQFYTYAMDQPILKPLAVSLRFTDVYTDPEKKIIENDKYKLNIMNPGEYEGFKVIQKSMDSKIDGMSFFSNIQSSGNKLYLVQMNYGYVGAYAEAIWEYDLETNNLKKIIELTDLNIQNMESFGIVGNDMYLTDRVLNGDQEILKIMKFSDGKLSDIDTSLYHNFHFEGNQINFFKVNNKLTYTTLIKNNDGYCYVLNQGNTKQELDCYTNKLNAAYIPVLNHLASNEYYDLYQSVMTNNENWQTEGKDSGAIISNIVYDKKGNNVYENGSASEIKLIGKNILVKFEEEGKEPHFEIFNLDTKVEKKYDNVSEFFYGLQDHDMRSFVFEVDDSSEISTPVFSNHSVFTIYNSVGKFDTKLPGKYLTLVGEDNSFIVSTDSEGNKMYLTMISYDK